MTNEIQIFKFNGNSPKPVDAELIYFETADPNTIKNEFVIELNTVFVSVKYATINYDDAVLIFFNKLLENRINCTKFLNYHYEYYKNKTYKPIDFINFVNDGINQIINDLSNDNSTASTFMDWKEKKSELKDLQENIKKWTSDFKLPQQFREDLIEAHALDLSKTNANEKILYLKKLGIIDFLQKNQDLATSVLKLSTALSAITGVDPKTLNPYVNAMISGDLTHKDNPLKNQKLVQKVENQLISLKITPIKS